MRELNRLGVTSAIDAGGGFQNYPDDYQIINKLAADGQLTIRIAYNLFTQSKGAELADFQKWTGMVKPGDGDDFLRHNGAGEMLVFSAADFEDFLEPRPDLAEAWKTNWSVVRHLVSNRWPFRLHATYDESISRMLDVFEKVNRDIRSMACTGSSTTPRPSPRATSSARRWAAALPSSTAWPSRANTSSTATVPRRPKPPAGQACWRWACRSVPAPMPPAWPATTRGLRCTGWSRAAPSAAPSCMARPAACRARPRWNCGPRQRLVLQRTGQEGPIQAGQLADLAVLSADFFSVHEDDIKAIESV
jgi:hypothetical protein